MKNEQIRPVFCRLESQKIRATGVPRPFFVGQLLCHRVTVGASVDLTHNDTSLRYCLMAISRIFRKKNRDPKPPEPNP